MTITYTLYFTIFVTCHLGRSLQLKKLQMTPRAHGFRWRLDNADRSQHCSLKSQLACDAQTCCRQVSTLAHVCEDNHVLLNERGVSSRRAADPQTPACERAKRGQKD